MKATIDRITTKSDGESKVVLTLPASELPDVLRLSLLLEKLLDVTMTEAPP